MISFLQMQKLLTFVFSIILAYVPYLMIRFNDTLTNDIVSFEQLDPGVQHENNTLMPFRNCE